MHLFRNSYFCSIIMDFLDLLALNYGAGMTLLDFAAAPEPARVMINDWVAEQTEDRILDLIPPNEITRDTVLVLTNAIYFNAARLHPFDDKSTAPGEFEAPDGLVTVDMMQQTGLFRYAEVENCRAVELPYDGEELSMVIVLPEEGSFETFESSLSESKVSQILENMNERDIAVSLPKFSFTSDFALRGTLKKMGMSDAFNGSLANFNGMTEIDDALFISGVVHKAFVSVNEKGTEAAAATAVIVVRGVAEDSLELNRPFIFFIRDIQTGAVVFLGRVMNPTV